MTTPPPPSPEKRALIDAFDTVMKADAERRDAEPRPDRGKRTRPFAWVALAVVGLAVLAGILVRPDWIGLGSQLHETPAMQEASLRFALVMEAQRVARYERTHGALPVRLEDAGPVMPGITYRKAAGGYELMGANGAATLTYRSSDSPNTFLGHSLNVLSGRGK